MDLLLDAALKRYRLSEAGVRVAVFDDAITARQFRTLANRVRPDKYRCLVRGNAVFKVVKGSKVKASSHRRIVA